MAAASETIQTIARLTPLAEVLALIDREVKPVAPRRIALTHAWGATLAADVVASAQPAAPLALSDGWALNADLTRDAGGYAPAPLPQLPVRIETGRPMPAGTDSVAAFDTVTLTDGGAEALAPVNPGDGVLPSGGDCDGSVPMRRAGERLRAIDLAAVAGAGVTRVSARTPRLRIVPVRTDTIIGSAARLIATDAARCGGAPDEANGALSEALSDESTDAIVAIGGTGSGRNDASVQTLARAGRLVVHGLALTPGETAAFGFVGAKPVLLLPGRLDAALAVWLVVGRRMLDRLAAVKATEHEPAETLTLARKVTSTVGLAELVPVRRNGDKAEALATKYLPLAALARSDGWILVPADSEGYSAGAPVQIRPWP
jgi:molybdopterin biosynthesis enzyme